MRIAGRTVAAASIGAIAIVIAIAGRGPKVSFMVGWRSRWRERELPALLWRDMAALQHGGRCGVLFGIVSSIALVIISPKVWPGADAEGGALAFYDLANPGIISIPLGFLGCWLGTMLSVERGNEREFAELYVRSETGLGAEKGGVAR